jgi:DNA segregation ATPase FtsK/SpoIIIE, S-DNA-T family
MAEFMRSKKTTLLPEGVQTFIRKRIREIFGFCTIIASLLLVLSVLSYSPSDASLNTATGFGYDHLNLLGLPGAYIADILIQWFGLSSLLICFAVFVWGTLYTFRGKVSSGLTKACLLLLSLIPLCGFFSLFHHSLIGPMPAGMGGVVGILLTTQIQAFNTLSSIMIGRLLLMFLFGFVGFGLYLKMLNLNILLSLHVFKPLKLLWFILKYPFTFKIRYVPVPRETNEGRREPVFGDTYSSSENQDESRSHHSYDRGDHPPFKEQDEVDEDSHTTAKTLGVLARVKKSIVIARKNASLPENMENLENYQLPSLQLINQPEHQVSAAIDASILNENSRSLEGILQDFGVKGEIIKVRPGPVVTLYELIPAPGVKSSRVISLADDIARSMSAFSVRIAVIPGRNAIGIEMPNAKREKVFFREMLASHDYKQFNGRLPLVLGKDIGGAPVIVDLAKMPHLLIAGTTGSGKSVAVNTMIMSLLYSLSPEECRLIMVDPKMLELSVYEGIPHLLAPVVTDPKKAVVALRWVVKEMENRYRAMSKIGVRNIEGYNARFGEASKNKPLSRKVQTGFDEEGDPVYEEEILGEKPLPYIVVLVDELADLMLVAGKDIEGVIQRLAQMARAAGIHLIMATQRPSVDVVTGTIKANFPTRISFQVTSKIDSRTILGESGAEQLLGQGDMLFMAGGGRITRVHGPFLGDQDVENIVSFLKSQGSPQYNEGITEDADDEESGYGSDEGGFGASGDDPIYDKAVHLVCSEKKASTSFIQRHLRIGYNSAARIIERMEKEGIVSAANHVGKREVLVGKVVND